MSIVNYVLIAIIVILIILLISIYKKLGFMSEVLDEILGGNLNQRIRFQNHISVLKVLSIKINNIIEKFQKVYEKNKISEEARKKMISNISHDLRTPLTSMIGYMELIIDDNNLSKDDKEKYIKIVYNKGNYLYTLMEDFFQISKLDSKDIKLEISEINISEIIRQNIILFFNDIKELNINPKINFPEEEVYAFGDEKALNRILGNLINNSLKYGAKGNYIGIDLTYDEDNVFIDVWDNGEGIPENEINHVFDRLYTVEKSRNLNLRSSGLGLTIVRKLVDALGGTICLSSIPFEKTVFTFTLPKKLRKS